MDHAVIDENLVHREQHKLFFVTVSKSPAGTTDNSPAIYRWERWLVLVQAPEGRKKSFQIALHIFHPVFLEKHSQIILESELLVVFRLPLNILRRVCKAGNADAECSITFLPFEVPVLLERVMNPFRGIAFEQLDAFRHGKCGGNGEEDVDMIFHAANHQRLHLVLACDAAKVRPETFLQVGLDERAAFFGREHSMHEAIDEGMHGVGFLSSLMGLVLLFVHVTQRLIAGLLSFALPGLKHHANEHPNLLRLGMTGHGVLN